MLSYKDHTQDCWTQREQFFYNDPEGDLVYDSGECTTVERLEDGLRIKVRIDKSLNWREMADVLRCEVLVMKKWAEKLRRQQLTFADMEVIERDPDEMKRWKELSYTDQSPYLYLYFYDELNWVMYENDDEYLFVFDFSFDNIYLGAKGMEGLSFTPWDCLCGVTSWLCRWYDRVNGYQEE